MQWLLDLLCEGFDDFVEERKEVGKDKPELPIVSKSTTTSEENEDKKSSLSSRASQTITLHTSQSSIVQAAAINDSDNGFKNFMIKILHCFGICCSLTYTLCPPIPCCIVKKVAFHPPKGLKSYKIIVQDEKGNKFEVETAKKAKKYSSMEIFPNLIDPLRNIKKFDEIIQNELKSTEGFIIKSKSGNDLIVAIFEPQKLFQIKNYQKKCVLFAQPNSSDIGHFMQPFLPASFHDFSNYIGVRFYAFDYSGYGRSTGKPSEKNIYYDIESVYSEIVKREGDDVMITVVGYSIGTAAVIDLASKNPKNIVGIVLLAPFTSGWRLIRDNPRIENSNCIDCFESIDKISNVNVPVLVCHGTNDVVVPISHGQKIYEKSKYKFDPLIVEDATHVNILNAENNAVQYAIRCFVSMCDKFPEMIQKGEPLEIQNFLNFD